MEKAHLKIRRYSDNQEKLWDEFIDESAHNGAFAVSRNFLNYHPKDRFKDHSLLVLKGEKIIALIPGCELEDDKKRVFYSHRGSTFGGIIVSKEYFNTRYLQNIVLVFEDYIKKEGFDKVVLRQVPNIFSQGSVGSLDYLLKLNRFDKYEELSFAVDISKIKNDEDTIEYFRWNTKQQTRQGLDFGLTVKELNDEADIKSFRDSLEENLKKHGATPIHTTEELLDLKKRFPEIVKFFGCFKDNKIVGSAMTWLYNQQTLHLQNICIDYEYQKFRPSNVLNHYFINLCKEKKWSYYSFGISTEDDGNKLNFGLAKFKEGFGAEGFINKIFYKDY